MTSEERHLVALPDDLKNELTEIISVHIICRICANQSDKLIGIYSEDGANNDLANKMNLYLPIKVSEVDNLPLQCCWQCASTVLAWHDLVVTSTEADKRLRSYQMVTEKQLQAISYKIPESGNTDDNLDQTIINKEIVQFGTIDEELNNETAIRFGDESLEMAEEGLCDTEGMDFDLEMETPYITVRKDMMIGNKIRKTSSISSSNATEKTNAIRETPEEYNYECSMCSKLFSSECDISEHIKQQHPDVHGGDDDDDDDEFFLQKDGEGALEEINDAEDETKTPEKKKGKVSRRFTVKHMMNRPQQKIDQDLVNKAKLIVDGRVFYKCNDCGKSLHSMYTYVWHLRIHTGERPYVCHLCGKQFRVSQGLVRHLKETHERIKNFGCDICGRYFSTKRNVEEHRRIHTNERPYVCALCRKSFKQKASLFVHNRSHSTEFPFTCTYCTQKFRTKQSLLTHITRHTGEKPFPCDVCGRSFRIKYELKRHKLVHSEEKPFSCKMCNQTFRQKRYLRNHLKLNHHIANPNELIDDS